MIPPRVWVSGQSAEPPSCTVMDDVDGPMNSGGNGAGAVGAPTMQGAPGQEDAMTIEEIPSGVCEMINEPVMAVAVMVAV